MRIIGEGTRDYYDTAGWADQSRVFERVRYDQQTARRNNWGLPILLPKAITGRADERGVHTEISFGICCVAGEAYPWARKSTWMGNRIIGAAKSLSDAHIYDPEEALAEIRTLTKRRRGAGLYWMLMSEAADPEQFMRLPKDALSAWCLDQRAATAILFPARPAHYKDPHDRAHGMINCDGLDKREIYKVLDPATAHMRIDGYVSGVLPANEDLVEIADAHRISKAGFDRQSFRTRPGTKKPRRAKRDEE